MGLWFPLHVFVKRILLLQKLFSRRTIQRHASGGSVGGLAVKGIGDQVKGASPVGARLAGRLTFAFKQGGHFPSGAPLVPCGAQGKRPCRGPGEPPGEAPLQACFGSGVRLPPSLLESPMNTV